MAGNPFVYVNSITTGKEPEFGDGDGYSAFLVNRALSYNYDCVMQSQIMNEKPWLDPRHQYAFLYNTVEKKRRKHSKWADAVSDADLELIMQVYGCNKKVAIGYLSLLNKESLQKLKDSLFRGGRDAKS